MDTYQIERTLKKINRELVSLNKKMDEIQSEVSSVGTHYVEGLLSDILDELKKKTIVIKRFKASLRRCFFFWERK